MLHTNLKKLAVALGLVCFMFSVTRCGQNNTQTAPAPTFTYIYTSLLKTACIECHVPSGGQNNAQLDFTSQATAYQTLLNSTVHGASSVGNCGSAKIVVAGTPASSYLLTVLIAAYNVNPFPGTTMCAPYSVHLQDQNVSAAEQNALVSWVQGGALNN